MKRIVADPAKCLACKACEVACALAHADTDDLVQAIAGGAKPRIYVEFAGGFAVPLQCRHCEDAPCLAVCPSGAIRRLSDSAPVLVDADKCIGCSYCVEACPFGVVQVVPRPSSDGSVGGKAVIKCDLCVKRQAQGLDPACASSCPVEALAFEDVDSGAKRARLRTAAKAVAFGDGK